MQPITGPLTDAPGADTVLMVCNSTTGFGHSLSSDLLKILAEQEPYLPADWRPAPVAADLLEALGSWFWGPAPHTLRGEARTRHRCRRCEGV